MKKIAIIGTGYVGNAMITLFAPEFEVVTYDLKMLPAILRELEDEAGEREDWAWDIDQAEAVALSRAREPLRGADLAIVCVSTPSGADGAADISAVHDVASWIGDYAELVLIKSTVPPGTTCNLNRATGGGLVTGKFHFSPEYIGEGKNFVPPWDYPSPNLAAWHEFVIVGGPTPERVLAFFQAVMATSARYIETDSTTAELAKYAENAFLAVKLRFCFELAEIAETLGVSYNELRELWLNDSRVGRSHTLVKPGQHYFSGKCLPKDLSAIVHAAEAAGVMVPMLATVHAENELRRKEAEGK